MKSYKFKRSQSELITTVLLILISITAVVLVSTFVINLIRTKLKDTECLQTVGQLSINTGYSYFNTIEKVIYLSIERGEKDFNLSGINIIYGNEYSTKKISIKPGTVTDDVRHVLPNGSLTNIVALPDSSETKSYRINVTKSGLNLVNTVILEAIIGKDISCGKVDEQTISFKAG